MGSGMLGSSAGKQAGDELLSSVVLVDSNPGHLHDLSVSFELGVVNSFLPTPIAANGDVEDDVEGVVERPCLPRGRRFLSKFVVLLVVAHERYPVRSPIDGVDMELADVDGDHSADLGVLHVVELLCVHCPVHIAAVVANMLHDVDFTTLWPVTECTFRRQHPGGCPRTPSCGQLEANLHSAVFPVLQSFGDKTCRGELLPLEIFPPGMDPQGTFRNERIVRSVGVVLKLVISPSMPAFVVGPFLRIWWSFIIEFIRPDEFPGVCLGDFRQLQGCLRRSSQCAHRQSSR
mmetsp:Transcript_13876/g.30617  ORF Transcript_13876/g.30617 Transcript_13876/m.30617 type:complete len:289 (-) Transcript_13876:1286-2152(-)